MVAEAHQLIQSPVESRSELAQLKRAGNREERSVWSLWTMHVLEDLPIGLTEHIHSQAACLLPYATWHLALKYSVGSVGIEEVTDAGKPKQTSRGRYLRAGLAVGNQQTD